MDIIFLIIYALALPSMLHIMQQESYQNDGMYRWILKNPKKAFKRGFIGFLLTTVVAMLSAGALVLLTENAIKLDALTEKERLLLTMIPFVLAMSTFVIYNIVIFIKSHKERKSAKKPLKYTARVYRLIFFNIIAVAILEVFFVQTFDIGYSLNNIMLPILYSFLVFTLPVNMILANWLASPTENFVANRFITKAYRKLHQKEYKNLIRIGITGSYGKTSTKYILKTILSEKYNVLATPWSYNTTMGNVRVIREQLKPEHEVFISEMGARKKHDIREICDFVKPHIGLITSIGPQHLETFKTIENVAKTKGELLDGVKDKKNTQWESSPYDTILGIARSAVNPFSNGLKKSKDEDKVDSNTERILDDGAVFLPKDGAECEALFNIDSHDNKFLFAIDNKDASIYAKNIKATNEGTSFTVVSTKYGEYDCKSKLLGEHNVQNIIGAIAIAEYMGLSKEQIINGCSKIEPVEHRLQLLPSTNGTTVIDDAFNSNPAGSKAALDVLSKFTGRKIIVTPGMVELGEEEDKLNKEFGKQMASVVDVAILVGPKHTLPIQEGLKEAGFDDMSIYVVPNLDEATKRLAKVTKVGDVILFENDLPDSYNE